jgi:DNA-binding transcriptional regulator YiaG
VELLHQLPFCHRTIRAKRSTISPYFRQLRRYPAAPCTIGEHLRKKRIDMQLSMTQLADLLGLGITDSAIEKWEKNQNRPTEEHRQRIVGFLGFNPVSTNSTGES